MVKDGLLDKYGKPNENTPAEWNMVYSDVKIKSEAATPVEKIRETKVERSSPIKREVSESSGEEAVAAAVVEKKKKHKKHKHSTDQVEESPAPVVDSMDAEKKKKKKKKSSSHDE